MASTRVTVTVSDHFKEQLDSSTQRVWCVCWHVPVASANGRHQKANSVQAMSLLVQSRPSQACTMLRYEDLEAVYHAKYHVVQTEWIGIHSQHDKSNLPLEVHVRMLGCICMPGGALPAVGDRWQCINFSGYVVGIDNVAPSVMLPIHNAHLEGSFSLH